MALSTINSDVRVAGDLSATTMTLPSACVSSAQVASSAGIERTKMGVTTGCLYTVPLTSLRVFDSLATLLPVTAANDDLGITSTTYGTNPPLVNTGDVKTANSTRYARFMVPLPAEYETGDSVVLRIAAGMVTTVASNSCTVDAEVWEVESDGTYGAADLCATAAQSINSLVFANKDFTITASSLAPGDMLDVRIAIAYNDVATGTEVKGAIAKIQLVVSCRG